MSPILLSSSPKQLPKPSNKQIFPNSITIPIKQHHKISPPQATQPSSHPNKHFIEELQKTEINSFFIPNPQIHYIHCGSNYSNVKIFNKNHFKLSNENTVTEYINSTPHSYLLNPLNIENKFYFATRNPQTKAFTLTFNYNDNNKWKNISLSVMNSFLNEINGIVITHNNIMNHSTSKCKRAKCLMEYIGMTVLIIGLLSLIAIAFVSDLLLKLIICCSPVLILLGMIVMLIGKCSSDEYGFKEINYQYLCELSDCIMKWNKEVFMLNEVLITFPMNLSYLQFNVDKRWKLVVEHLIPIIKRKV